MSEPLDDRYATFREHADLHRQHSALEAGVNNQLTNINSNLSDIKTMLVARPPPQQETAAALALHRALDAVEKKLGGGGSSPAVTALAIIGACALTAAGMWLLLHR